MNSKKVRVRYAPSPTGFLHIGNAQSALFNYLFAEHFHGTMVLRIEDTDMKRNVPHGEDSQIENLHWLGIDWDEGPDKPNPKYAPYHQSQRVALYHKYIQQLLHDGRAYKDYTTEDELKIMREEQRKNGEPPHYNGRWYGRSVEDQQNAEKQGLKPDVRLHLPENHVYAWNDIVKGNVQFNSDNMGGDFIIEKSNGMPTYNFAVVIDDYLMDITHVLRGDDHIANTPKQIAVYEGLGITPPKFGHITLIYNPKTGKKLSKRDKETLQFISQYRAQGYLSEAIFNFIAFLGWSPVGEKELYSKPELIKAYDPDRMSRSPAFFDQSKLDWMNSQYIKNSSISTLTNRILDLINEGESDIAVKLQTVELPNLEEFIWHVTEIYQREVYKLTDIMQKVYFFANIEKQTFNYCQFNKFPPETVQSILMDFKKEVLAEKNTEDINFNEIIKLVGDHTGESGKQLYFPMNIAFTGQTNVPRIGSVLKLYSISTIINLVNKALSRDSTKNR
ncbi:glutamate--tRNA ligase [Lentilactobacillus fungorum]|uniref:Glutamate--tRNA ligase n=1 Tax=Lentilactobacillus fungorum TaxID=2201250 RepID=A0ABQ3W195_9LACO|nr:glutamate--tRNA ligase [Lentilactobacillus fungorum]GHP13939.1 glutamate--tRNA ligase [Lentilactobacillus fungorum]